MASIGKHKFHVKSAAGQEICFEAKMSAAKSGMFKIEFPNEYLADISANCHIGCRAYVDRDRSFVEGKVLERVIASIDSGLRSILDTQTINELVIRYAYETQCHYVTNRPNGMVFPNGAVAKEETGIDSGKGEGLFDWKENGAERTFSLHNPPSYSISLQARVYHKQTFKAPSGEERVKYYGNVCHADGLEFGRYGELLNSFTHTKLEKSDLEIPYTEESAKFFYESILGLCTLSEQLTEFFKDQEAMLYTIATGGNLLGWTFDD